MASLTYEILESRLAAWAQSQPDIRAVLVCGSRARGTQDRWSDLDSIILTTERPRFAADPSWLNSFGTPWLTYRDDTGPGDPEWFALYDDGLKLDAVLLEVNDPSQDLDALLRLYPYQGVFSRGLAVLYDSLGKPRTIPARLQPPPSIPTEQEFSHIVNGFLLESVTTAKFIGRGDFWRAQKWLSADLRPRILRIIEWHAHGRDTWYDGRNLNEWADPRAASALPQTFAAAHRESLAAALRSLLLLAQEFGRETAAKFGYEYPAAAHDRVSALVDTILDAG